MDNSTPEQKLHSSAPGFGGIPGLGGDPRQLRRVIYDVDCLAQGGLSEIRAIAQLTLAAMESRDNYPDQAVIALALRTIWGTASSVSDCISTSADEVGCAYSDEDHLRRQDAYLASLNKGKAAGWSSEVTS